MVERVKELHKLYPYVSVTTDVVEFGDRVSVKATIEIGKNRSVDGAGIVCKFTGHSQAKYGAGMMGDVALEVAETSAVGRALGFAGIGLIDGIASADEMRKVKSGDVEDLPF